MGTWVDAFGVRHRRNSPQAISGLRYRQPTTLENGNGRAGLKPLGRLAIHEGMSNVNSTTTVAQPGLLPDGPMNEDSIDRFYHRDIAGLEPLQAWAEIQTLSNWLAEQIFHRRRPAMLWGTGGAEDCLSSHDWVQQRIQRLERLRTRRAA